MCKQKNLIPMNCDVFCFEDITQKQFRNINITGSIYINAKGTFKANNAFVGEDFIAFENPLSLKKVKIGGNLICEKCAQIHFTSLEVKKGCTIGTTVPIPYKEDIKLIDCDVFCIDGNLPRNICITGNLYIANGDANNLSDIDIGEDIFIDSSHINAYNIRSQGTTYVYGEHRKSFSFGSFTSLEGCEIYSDAEEQ